MGRGDIKTKKGKIFAGSFGKKRPAKVVKKAAVAVVKKKAAAKKESVMYDVRCTIRYTPQTWSVVHLTFFHGASLSTFQLPAAIFEY
ncbi:MAG: 30S ribosomal protein THX [Chitinophagaceae bacterium]|nr:30S ribosomal protein THX [Chitinophagaceae bacterium]